MRASSFAVVAGVLLAACATTNPYGPSGEERLDAATAGISPDVNVAKANARHLEAIQAQSCDDAHAQLAAVPKKDKTDQARLADLTGLIVSLRTHKKGMEKVLDRHPGLKFFKGKAADGRSYDIQATVHACTADLAQVDTTLDQLIRKIVRSPLVSKVVGHGRHRHWVTVARVDFDLVTKAIETLAPVDSDVLMTQVERAKKQLAVARGHRRHRHRR